MKIAVIGAGYTGIACAWHLLHSPLRPRELSVTIYDQQGLGGGASGIAAGLLHPFVGLAAKLNRKGWEGLQATKRLVEESSLALGKPVADTSGILRVAVSEEQDKNFKRCAMENDRVEWWDKNQCQKKAACLAPLNGIFISSGCTVFSKEYLQGLWKSCEIQRAEIVKVSVTSLRDLRAYDRIIVAAGSGTLDIEECQALPITLVKGQLLELEWPVHIPPLPFSVISQAYVVMSRDRKSCIAGATYERNYESRTSDIEIAKREILPKLQFLPHLQSSRIIGCRSQFRVSTKDHLPLAKQIDSRTWVLTGMGSKGLLYHALFAQELSEKMFKALH